MADFILRFPDAERILLGVDSLSEEEGQFHPLGEDAALLRPIENGRATL